MSRQFSGWTWFFCFLPMWGMLILLEFFVGEHLGCRTSPSIWRQVLELWMLVLPFTISFTEKKNPKSCMYQYYHPKPKQNACVLFHLVLFPASEPSINNLWHWVMPTFPSSPSWCKAHLKKNTVRFPRRIFILQRSPTSKITTKKGGYVEIQMIDFRSNNPSTHGELIAFCYDVVFGAAWQRWTGKFQRTIVNLLPKTKGKVMKFAEKKDPSLFSWVNLLNCLVSNNLNLFV